MSTRTPLSTPPSPWHALVTTNVPGPLTCGRIRTGLWTLVVATLVCVTAVCAAQDAPEDQSGFVELRAKFEAEKGKEPYERLQTIVDFGPIISPKVVPFLIGVFDDENNPAIAAAALRALGMQRTLEAVQFIVEKGIPRLLGDFANFPAVGEALSHKLDDKVEKWLLRNLLSPGVRKNPDAVKMALDVLSNLQSPKRFDTLAKMLKGASESRMQVAILRAFRDHRPKNAAKVAKAFIRAKVKTVQMMALEVMYEVKDKKHKSRYIKLLKSSYPEVRILAIDLLSQAGERKLVKLVAPLLKKKDKTVRIAAVHALARTVKPEAVQVLIAALDDNEGRVKDDIIDVLTRLTGEYIGSSGVQWESWWAVKKDTADLRWRDATEFERVRNKNQGKEQKTVTYYGLRVLSDKVCFVIDLSESMIESYDDPPPAADPGDAKKSSEHADPILRTAEDDFAGNEKGQKKGKRKRKKKVVQATGPTKISVAKNELRSVVKSLPDDILVNVIGFETFVTPWKPEMQKLHDDTRAEIQEFIDKGSPSGMTNVFGSIEAAFKDSRVDTIYLLSDGAPTHGRHIEPEDILRAVGNINRYRKVRINTIGFALTPKEEKLMQDLADQNFGIFIRR